MSSIAPARLAEVFVELADTLVDEFDLIVFMQLVASRTTELTGASATGLLLVDAHERLQFIAASDERVENLDLFQVQADEGPCRDCFQHGAPVIVEDLQRTRGRWPRFAAASIAAGFLSSHAFPLRLRQQVIGALGMFSTRTGLMAADDVAIVQALADVATIGMLQERAIRRGEVLAEQLQGALSSRIVIEQAKGIIAQSRGVSVQLAFEILRTHCRQRELHLSEVAQAIVNNPSLALGLHVS